jgi:hypothetical protein
MELHTGGCRAVQYELLPPQLQFRRPFFKKNAGKCKWADCSPHLLQRIERALVGAFVTERLAYFLNHVGHGPAVHLVYNCSIRSHLCLKNDSKMFLKYLFKLVFHPKNIVWLFVLDF